MSTNKISPYSFPGIKLENLPQRLLLAQKKLNYKIAQESILKLVAEECGVTVGEIISESRKREIVDARHIYFASIRLKFRITLTKMGKDTGNRDHTTVLHGLKKFNERYLTEDAYKEISNRIFDKLGIEYSDEKLLNVK